MNSVQLSQQVLFLVIGYPGAGKSYFSRQFAELIKGVHLNEDRIRYELFEQPTYSADEKDIVDRMMNYFMEEMLETGKPVVYDGSLSVKERKKLRDKFRAAKLPIVTIWVQTDLETSFDRASTRDRRSTDDKYSPSMSFEAFDAIQKVFKKPSREPALVISGKHLFRTQAASVVRRLKKAKLIAEPKPQPTATVPAVKQVQPQQPQRGINPNRRHTTIR